MTALWVLLALAAGSLVVFLALFEIAFFASSQIAVRALGEGAEEARALRERLDDPLAVLIPARLGVAVAAGLAAFSLDRLGFAPAPLLGFAALAAVWFLLRELVPAAVLLRDPEEVLRGLLPWFGRWDRLVRVVADPLRRGLRRVYPLPGEADEDASDEEVEAFLETGEEEGILEEEEAAMVRGVLELDEMRVREVMTPRPAVMAGNEDASRQEIERLIARSRHRRIPIFGPRDRVIGVVDAVDLIAVPAGDQGLAALLRPVLVVPETKRVDDLLREFRRSKQTFAVVVDEHASVSGIVTLTDISEEIVGEVREEGASKENVVAALDDGSFLVGGAAELDEVARQTGLSFPESLNGAAFDTMSGFVLAAWRRIPEPGEAMEREGLAIEVVEADGRRIQRVRISRRAG